MAPMLNTFTMNISKRLTAGFLACLILGSFLPVFSVFAQNDPATTTPDESATLDFMRGRVEAVVHEDEVEDLNEPFIEQTLRIKIESGVDKDVSIDAVYRIRAEGSRYELQAGDRVVVVKTLFPGDPTPQYEISEPYRIRSVWLLAAVFVIVVLLLTGRRGVMAFVGLGISILTIVFFVTPRILHGANPLLISLIGALVMVSASLLIAHGWRVRTFIAFGSSLIALILSAGITIWIVGALRLSGIGSEEAFYLQYAPVANIDLRGLLLGGIIIGVLGILDDVTTAQAAAVEEIHLANPSLGFRELVRRGFSIGREHIVSLVNTLVLVYVGASFPLLLLLFAYPRPAWVTVNSEFIIEEIVRTFIGSLVLAFAVPITTLIAAHVYSRGKK